MFNLTYHLFPGIWSSWFGLSRIRLSSSGTRTVIWFAAWTRSRTPDADLRACCATTAPSTTSTTNDPNFFVLTCLKEKNCSFQIKFWNKLYLWVCWDSNWSLHIGTVFLIVGIGSEIIGSGISVKNRRLRWRFLFLDIRVSNGLRQSSQGVLSRLVLDGTTNLNYYLL